MMLMIVVLSELIMLLKKVLFCFVLSVVNWWFERCLIMIGIEIVVISSSMVSMISGIVSDMIMNGVMIVCSCDMLIVLNVWYSMVVSMKLLSVLCVRFSSVCYENYSMVFYSSVEMMNGIRVSYSMCGCSVLVSVWMKECSKLFMWICIDGEKWGKDKLCGLYVLKCMWVVWESCLMGEWLDWVRLMLCCVWWGIGVGRFVWMLGCVVIRSCCYRICFWFVCGCWLVWLCGFMMWCWILCFIMGIVCWSCSCIWCFCGCSWLYGGGDGRLGWWVGVCWCGCMIVVYLCVECFVGSLWLWLVWWIVMVLCWLWVWLLWRSMIVVCCWVGGCGCCIIVIFVVGCDGLCVVFIRYWICVVSGDISSWWNWVWWGRLWMWWLVVMLCLVIDSWGWCLWCCVGVVMFGSCWILVVVWRRRIVCRCWVLRLLCRLCWFVLCGGFFSVWLVVVFWVGVVVWILVLFVVCWWLFSIVCCRCFCYSLLGWIWRGVVVWYWCIVRFGCLIWMYWLGVVLFVFVCYVLFVVFYGVWL